MALSFSPYTIDTSTTNAYIDTPFKGSLETLLDGANPVKLTSKRRTNTKDNTMTLLSTSMHVGTNPVVVRVRTEDFNTHSGKRRSNFKNSYTFAFKWGGRDRSIKYFITNGNMLINGCKGADEVRELATAFVASMANALGATVPKIDRVEYRMVNASFWVKGLPGRIDLSMMNAWCQSKGHASFYNPDKSPPLKLDVGVAKVTIYATGNVQIKAMKNFDDTEAARQKTIDVISGYLASL
jgi:TATA-box binding protein (TBP) (component of TFIID and TFIIIB)